MSSTTAPTRFRPKVAIDKRKRVSRACTTCRKLKRKCIPRSGNSCRKCHQNNLSCFFEEIPKDSETTGDASPEPRPLKWQNLTSFYGTIMTQMRRLHPELDLQSHHLDTLDQLFHFYQTPQSQDDRNLFYGDGYQKELSEPPTIDTDFLTKASKTINEASGRLLMNDNEAIPSIAINKVVRDEETDAVAIDCLAQFPSQSRAIALTTISLRGHQSNFYYCDQDHFRRRLAALYKHGLKTPLVTPAFVCFVATAMAMGCQFRHLYGDSSVVQDLGSSEEDENDTPGTKYLQLSQRLLPAVLEERSIETVQSCLLTAFLVLATDDLESYYIYTGLALRTAITLSLHRLHCDKQERFPSASLEESKRLFWTVYCIERRSSMMVGRSETLPVENITTPLPVWTMQLDKYDIDRVDRLTAFINLTRIQTHLLKTRPSDSSHHDLQQAQNLLEQWQEELPASCRHNDSNSTRSNIHFQIMYHMTWMQLGRIPLLAAVKASLRKAPNITMATSIQSQSPLTKLCTTSALAVIDLIFDLRDHGQIAFFSHLDLQSCSSSVTILLLARFLDQDIVSFEKLQEALGVLDLMSEKSQYARRGTQLVRQLYEALRSPEPETRGKERDILIHPLADVNTSLRSNDPILGENLGNGGYVSPKNDDNPMDNLEMQRISTQEINQIISYGPGSEVDDDFVSSALGSEFESWLNTYSTPDLYFFGFEGLETLW